MRSGSRYLRLVHPTEIAPYGSNFNRGWRLVVANAAGVFLVAFALSVLLIIVGLLGGLDA